MTRYSRWDAGQSQLSVIRIIDRFPKNATNIRAARISRQSYRRHHDRWYKPLIHNGRKP